MLYVGNCICIITYLMDGIYISFCYGMDTYLSHPSTFTYILHAYFKSHIHECMNIYRGSDFLDILHTRLMSVYPLCSKFRNNLYFFYFMSNQI